MMKDQITVQTTNEKFQQDIMFAGDQMQSQSNSAASFKNEDSLKQILISGLQKKVNPRLFIL
jgi:hypothetical protein